MFDLIISCHLDDDEDYCDVDDDDDDDDVDDDDDDDDDDVDDDNDDDGSLKEKAAENNKQVFMLAEHLSSADSEVISSSNDRNCFKFWIINYVENTYHVYF